MEVIIKLSGKEKLIIQNALRAYSDYIADELNKKTDTRPLSVTELLKKALLETDALYTEFSQL